MKPVREITAEEENFRAEPMLPGNPRFMVTRRDPVEPVPVGTYVAIVFKVTGYRPDCDGSLMATLAQVNRYGEESGWEENAVGLYPDSDVVLDDPGELHRLAGAPERERRALSPSSDTEAGR
jgi:hypothetical protein